MNPRLLSLWLGVAVLACSSAPTAGAEVGRKKILQAEHTLTKHFEKLEVAPGRLRYLFDERLTRAFPGHFFFQVRYAPGSGKRLPGGLEDVNLFVVGPDGRVQGLNDRDFLLTLFHGQFGGVKTERRAGEVARIFAVLVVARHPGFVFAPAEVKTVSDATGLTTVARRMVREGGTGHVEAEVRFGMDGKLKSLYWRHRLSSAPRIVRTAVRVKRATKVATEELQRLKVSTTTLRQFTDVELEQALPGSVIFSYVGDAQKGAGTNWARRDLIVVEADGNAVLLTKDLPLAEYARSVYDPIVTDEQARMAMRLHLRLLAARYSGVAFKPAGDSIRIEPLAGGGRTISARLEAATGATGHIDVTWRLGKLGRMTSWTVHVRPGAKS